MNSLFVTYRMILLGLAMLVLAGTAAAKDTAPKDAGRPHYRPILVFVAGANDNDRSFIQAARAGRELAEKELGIQVEEHKLGENENALKDLSRLAGEGFSPIITIGYEFVLPVVKIAEEFPETHFTVVDGMVPPLYPNVQSIVFKDHEGAFLVGMLGGMASEKGTLGFVGGMDIPLIRNFATGFAQGAKAANPKTKVDVAMIGPGSEAWNDPDRAYELAKTQIEQGADVVFAAAGGSGLGALRAAYDSGVLAIGVDINQNGIYSGHILTSLVKRVDRAVREVLVSTYQGEWKPGIKSLGLKEGAFDYAVDVHNKSLVSTDWIESVEQAKERIVRGLLVVESYSPN